MISEKLIRKMQTVAIETHFKAVLLSPVGRVAQSVYTDYGLGGSESNSSGDEIFRPSRPALGPTQPPVKWVPSFSRG